LPLGRKDEIRIPDPARAVAWLNWDENFQREENYRENLLTNSRYRLEHEDGGRVEKQSGCTG